MIKRPKFSIVVPVYNEERTLEKCLNSISVQSFNNFEVLLINDGSSDSSGIICDRFAESDQRFRVIHKKNEGVSATRNLGIDEAIGEYLLFVDSDDAVLEDYLKEYALILQDSKYDVVIGGHLRINQTEVACRFPKHLGEYQNNIWEYICLEPDNFGYICSKAFRLEIIKNNKIYFRTDMYSQEDFEFCLSVYEHCARFLLIDYSGYEYYYMQGKRKPPVWDFISNQLKLSTIAQNKYEISDDAKMQILLRVQLLLYSFLYGAENRQEFNSFIEKLSPVKGLKEYLSKPKINSETTLIAGLYSKGCYNEIFFYFQIRHKVRNMIRRFKK